jgi:hypothetical protein
LVSIEIAGAEVPHRELVRRLGEFVHGAGQQGRCKATGASALMSGM